MPLSAIKPRISKELVCLLSLWLMASLCLLGKSNSLQKYWTQRHHVSLPLATPFAAIDGQAQDAVDNSLQKGPLAFLSRQDPNEFIEPETPAPALARARAPAPVRAPIALTPAVTLASAAAHSAADTAPILPPGATASARDELAASMSATAIASAAASTGSASQSASADADAPAVAGKTASVAASAGTVALNTPAAASMVNSNPATAATTNNVTVSVATVATTAPNPQNIPATSLAGIGEAATAMAVSRYAATEKLALSKGDKILFAGDSLMQGLVPHITRGLRRDGFSHYLDASKQSTGFSYPATFDWPGKIKTAILRDGVNTVVIFIGANDAWSLASNGKLYSFGSPPWKAEYTRRVREVVQFAHQHKARVMWLELPPMHYDNLTKGRQVLNDIYRQVALEESAMFIPTARVVSDDQEKFGLFKTLADGKMAQTRLDDGVHFTKLGQTLISKAVLQHFTVQEAQQ